MATAEENAPSRNRLPALVSAAGRALAAWTERSHAAELRRREAPVLRAPSVDVSFTGLVFLGLTFFMGVAAATENANLLFVVFGIMIGALISSWLLCRLMLRRLRVERILPDSVGIGAPMAVTYRFINGKRFWPSLSVSVWELESIRAFRRQPRAFMLHVAPGQTTNVRVSVTPTRRGLHRLNQYQLGSGFPFGFLRQSVTRAQDETVLIHPAIGQVSPRLLAMCRSMERSGINRKPRVGGVDEFFGVKPFRAGESPRWIYWKRSARTGELVSREMAHVSPPRLMLLVDTCLLDRSPAEHAKIEKTLAMAATLASAALAAGMSAGVCLWDNGWSVVPPREGPSCRRDVLTALARASLNRDHGVHQLIEHGQHVLRDGATPIVITPRDIEVGLGELSRGQSVVVATDSPQAAAWFQFPENIDFGRCMPLDQEPETAKHPT